MSKKSTKTSKDKDRRKKLTKKKDFRNDYIPDFDIKNGPAFATLHIILEKTNPFLRKQVHIIE